MHHLTCTYDWTIVEWTWPGERRTARLQQRAWTRWRVVDVIDYVRSSVQRWCSRPQTPLYDVYVSCVQNENVVCITYPTLLNHFDRSFKPILIAVWVMVGRFWSRTIPYPWGIRLIYLDIGLDMISQGSLLCSGICMDKDRST